MKIKLLSMLFVFISFYSNAAAPTCSSQHGGYCSYSGSVKSIYVNKGGSILMYFDQAMSPSEPSKANMNVTQFSAGIINISDNPEFAKMFYSTALAAQSTGRNITIQMRGSQSGYPVIDRIWLKQ
ncbi:hypothetical protein B6A42_01950 [Vibrio coralliilyticus]|uniref:hypothetical protein n=1 Tax=Vibrio TaxID=662 RepID=UPI0009C1AD9B|nr:MULTISPECIES: hypothetical protein [Vibrio]ARC91144.1 hypothetical protein B6A42_01950 [Vibrio coralliilyticus]MCC2525321.1 hypothetical protein [Vibrio coralliilyticus]NRB68675.1 hypothetical protein [Vibrio sp.]NUW68879.1 hypothetical protein [Vibrio coralliilyticus]